MGLLDEDGDLLCAERMGRILQHEVIGQGRSKNLEYGMLVTDGRVPAPEEKMEVDTYCLEVDHKFAPVQPRSEGDASEWMQSTCLCCLKVNREVARELFLAQRGVGTFDELVTKTVAQIQADEKLGAEKRSGELPKTGSSDDPSLTPFPADAELRALAVGRAEEEFEEVLARCVVGN